MLILITKMMMMTTMAKALNEIHVTAPYTEFSIMGQMQIDISVLRILKDQVLRSSTTTVH